MASWDSLDQPPLSNGRLDRLYHRRPLPNEPCRILLCSRPLRCRTDYDQRRRCVDCGTQHNDPSLRTFNHLDFEVHHSLGSDQRPHRHSGRHQGFVCDSRLQDRRDGDGDRDWDRQLVGLALSLPRNIDTRRGSCRN